MLLGRCIYGISLVKINPWFASPPPNGKSKFSKTKKEIWGGACLEINFSKVHSPNFQRSKMFKFHRVINPSFQTKSPQWCHNSGKKILKTGRLKIDVKSASFSHLMEREIPKFNIYFFNDAFQGEKVPKLWRTGNFWIFSGENHQNYGTWGSWHHKCSSFNKSSIRVPRSSAFPAPITL